MSLKIASLRGTIGRGINFLEDSKNIFTAQLSSTELLLKYRNCCKELCKRMAGDIFVAGRSFKFEGDTNLTYQMILQRIHHSLTILSYAYHLLKENAEEEITSIEYAGSWFLCIYNEQHGEEVYDLVSRTKIEGKMPIIAGIERQNMCDLRGYLLNQILEILLEPITCSSNKDLVNTFLAIMSYDMLLSQKADKNIQALREQLIKTLLTTERFANFLHFDLIEKETSSEVVPTYIRVNVVGKTFLSTTILQKRLEMLLGSAIYQSVVESKIEGTYRTKFINYFSEAFMLKSIDIFKKVNNV